MKSSKLILGCLATLGLSAGAATVQADVDRDAIAERIKPVGQLCLQGEECGTAVAVAAAPAATGNGIDGGEIYNRVCMACHETGAAGAPVRGNADGWADRVDKGWEELLANSINGIGAMPARGGNPSLTDDEVAAATAYLLEPVMEVPELGAAEEAAAEEAAPEAAVTEAEPTPAEEAPAHAAIDGEAIYNQACMACHMTGAAGAPIKGDADAWAERLEKGMEELYANSISGIGAMPPKGGHTALSDDEVKAAVDFMVEAVQ